MRQFLLTFSLVALLSVTACAKKAEESGYSEDRRVDTVDVRQPPHPASMVAPGIDPRSAPGVAFSYRYDFVLPDKSIAAVQEVHAAVCEKLGPTQCRITGMRYTLLDDQRISANLELKLAPELARAFGKDGIAAVEKAAGKLVNAEITGNDVGATIEAAKQTGVDAASQLAETERKLRAGGLGDEERAQLEAQAGDLRAQIASTKSEKTVAQAQLASTPMAFSYEGDIGFSLGGNPVGEALHATWASLSGMIWFVLTAVGVALPWVLLAALLLVLWRSRPGLALRKFLRGKSREAVRPAESPNV